MQCNNTSFSMSSNESAWMSRGLIPPLGVTTYSVAECCNGLISWWNGLQRGNNNNNYNTNENEEEEAASLMEPLVMGQATTQVMMIDEEERVHVVSGSNLFLCENVDQTENNPAREHCSDTENAPAVTNDNEIVHSLLEVHVDENDCQDERPSNPLIEKGADIENALVVTPPPHDESLPLPSGGEHEQDKVQSTATIGKSPFSDEHQLGESQVCAQIKQILAVPLDIENEFLVAKVQPRVILDNENNEKDAKPSSIFRSRLLQPGEAKKKDDNESIDAQQNFIDEKHEVTKSNLSSTNHLTTLLPATSLVPKRVSGLIAIFETLSTDEDENNNGTPTSLCSSSSFSTSKSAQDSTCPCCKKKIYPTDATIAYHEKIFHGGCFKCHLCDRKFSLGMSEVAGMIPTTHDDPSKCMLSCTKCRDNAAVKHIPLRKSTPACQSITITTPEKGNIQQVKHEIGDDLESVIDGMIPRCAICGIHFLGGGGGDMMILGMNKYHSKCRMYGRPMVERCERKVLPIVAANYAPESLVVRIRNTTSSELSSTSSQQEIMTTLYFILPDKAADLQRIRGAERPNENVNFDYVMDSSAYANPNYSGTKKNPKTTFPCHGVGVAEQSHLSVGFLGDPCGLPIQLANTRIEHRDDGKRVFCAELECFKFQLRHRFDLVMHTTSNNGQDETLADLKTATLSMHIAG